ncbi:MAG: DarT ssDNA thymidine ADP-ribosyltransferase family protein [Parvularculales bacterium]
MSVQKLIEYIKNREKYSCLYHFTDKENLASIDEHGLLSTRERESKGINPKNRGGDVKSHRLDREKGLDKYVCLSFTDYLPLYFAATNDGRIPNPTYLKIDPEILHVDNVAFTYGVATAHNAIRMPIAGAIEQIYRDIYGLDEEGNPTRPKNSLSTEAHKSEILVPKRIEQKMIIGKV